MRWKIMSSLLLVLVVVTAAPAQVRVTVPAKKFPRNQKIAAKVSDETGQPITVCVASGQISTTKQVVVSTPIPFEIEEKIRERWKAAMVSPESGGERHAVILDSNKSLEFPFWPPSAGNFRLRMKYWEGAHPDLNCEHPPSGARETKAAVFEVPVKLD